jgi:hypothetical protein
VNHRCGGAAEGLLASSHFVQEEAEGEDVRAGIEIVAADLLRGHVGGSAADDTDERDGILRAFGAGRRGVVWIERENVGDDEFGEAEIEDFGLAAFRDENVGGFDVAVNDAAEVSDLEGVGNLDAEAENFFERLGLAVDVLA